MRNEGVLAIKHEGIELSLSPGALFPNEAKTKEDTSGDTLTAQSFDPDAMLFWSSPGYDNTQGN